MKRKHVPLKGGLVELYKRVFPYSNFDHENQRWPRGHMCHVPIALVKKQRAKEAAMLAAALERTKVSRKMLATFRGPNAPQLVSGWGSSGDQKRTCRVVPAHVRNHPLGLPVRRRANGAQKASGVEKSPAQGPKELACKQTEIPERRAAEGSHQVKQEATD
ncbi:hypothetical protein FS749_003400 [Ceratobasidium sp. UAMH 11750]|nr:hypothetical protein FS749_003400 [Ceratobasidium sp. UAMH 11750]